MSNQQETSTSSFDELAGTPASPRKVCWFKKVIIGCLGFEINNLSAKQKLTRRQRKEARRREDEFYMRTSRELLENSSFDSFLLESSRRLLSQQRVMEDTKARRRLESWARNTIIIYLIVVCLLVLLNGLSQLIWTDIFSKHGFITDTVMTVILSTTTINIIGLGVIVLKGHFPNNEKDAQEKDATNSNKTTKNKTLTITKSECS